MAQNDDNMDLKSESSESDIFDTQNEEGWEDVEKDEEDIKVVSLFDDKTFPDAKSMLVYCKDSHGFDIWSVKRNLGLDYLGLIKLVNYVRSQVIAGQTVKDISSGQLFEDEKYLKPVLEDDALLYSLDDVFDDDVDEADKQEEGEVEQLRRQLATLQTQFSAYREEVQNSLLQRLEREDDPAAQASTKKDADTTEKPKSSARPKELADDDYFNSYSYNTIHELMLKDKIRTDSYRDFIYENKHIFKDKIVLDVGCGTGILSMFCAKAGAKLVIAVDNSEIITKARENVFTNGLQDKIKCLRGKIEEVVLPVPKVDIIVSEWMGYCLLYESMLDSVIHARDKYLAPDGLMVPSHTTIRLAPLADSELKESHIDFWRDVYGFDMTSMLERVHEEALIRVSNSKELAAESVPVLVLDLHTAKVEDLDFSANFALKWKDGYKILEGFVLWFDTFFFTSRKQEFDVSNSTVEDAKAKGIVAFSTGPASQATHWQQGILLIKDPSAQLSSEDEISGKVTYQKKVGQERSLDIDIQWTAANQKSVSQIWFLD